MLWSFYQNIP